MEGLWRGLQSWFSISGMGWMMVAFSERENHRGEPRVFREEDRKFSIRHVEFKNS